MVETQMQEIDSLNQEIDGREEEIFDLKMENRKFYDVNVIQEQRMNSIKQMMTTEEPRSPGMQKSAFRKLEDDQQSQMTSQSLASE